MADELLHFTVGKVKKRLKGERRWREYVTAMATLRTADGREVKSGWHDLIIPAGCGQIRLGEIEDAACESAEKDARQLAAAP